MREITDHFRTAGQFIRSCLICHVCTKAAIHYYAQLLYIIMPMLYCTRVPWVGMALIISLS